MFIFLFLFLQIVSFKTIKSFISVNIKTIAMRYFHDKEMHSAMFPVIHQVRMIVICTSKNHACDIFSENSNAIQYSFRCSKTQKLLKQYLFSVLKLDSQCLSCILNFTSKSISNTSIHYILIRSTAWHCPHIVHRCIMSKCYVIF